MNLAVIIIFAQILAIGVHAYLLGYEKKYCGHCDWWWDTGAIINIVISLIPILGLFTSIAGCVDYMKNVTEELTKGKSSRW
jgi:hypothetical protein